MTERISVTLDMAKEAVDRCKTALKGPCDKCEYRRHNELAHCDSASLTSQGWEPAPASAAYFKRCDDCKGLRFPWAPKLDLERVREWMENYFNPTLAPGRPSVFQLDQLERLTK